MNLTRSYTIPSTVLLQCVDEESLLFNSANGLFFALNETGALLWEEIIHATTLHSVIDQMVEMYDVEREQLTHDVIVFAQTLADQGLLSFEQV